MGSMECQRARKAICILKRVMTVVPRCAVLSDPEFVCVMIAWSNGTLTDSVHAVMFERVEQPHAMPVNRCTIVPQMILNCDFHPITPASLDPWPWVLFIEGFAAIGTIHSISIDVVICDVEVVLVSFVRYLSFMHRREEPNPLSGEIPFGSLQSVHIGHSW